MPENEEILYIFALCDSQIRVSNEGFIFGLDWVAVVRAAEAHGIEINPLFYRLLRTFEATMVEERNQRRDVNAGPGD